MEHHGQLTGIGYSGHGIGKNVPAQQVLQGSGPLPRGNYTIGAPFQHPHAGAFTMRLTPAPGTSMYGRNGMLIHGENPAHIGQSSDGCIVISHAVRHLIWSSGDHQLQVVE